MTDAATAYKTLVDPYLLPGFSFRELVHEGLQNKQLPPQKYWSKIIRPLQLANDLRTRMMTHGARGLLIHAAYRPKGGALFSAHKRNCALDLDLLPGDFDLATEFVLEATTMLCTLGQSENIRIGTYGKPGSLASIRIHLDTSTGARTWQHWGSKVLSSAQSDVVKVAAKIGMAMPPRRW